MSQQHAQFEEELHDESGHYREGYTYSPSVDMPPAQAYGTMAGQKLQTQEPRHDKSGERLGLMIVSISFIFVLFIIAMSSPTFVSIFLALLFAAVMAIFNIVYSFRH